MNLATLFIIVYIVIVIIFLLMPKRAFHNLIRRDIDKDFKPENKGFVYRGVGYWRMVILGGGIVAVILTFFIRLIFY
ncbi:MAG: hypothetical protein HYU70_01215 [Bacteroidetes bacterium]|nr:hypothetical protein [Bacteroidota bacterium]